MAGFILNPNDAEHLTWLDYKTYTGNIRKEYILYCVEKVLIDTLNSFVYSV